MGLKDLNFQGVIFSKEFRNIGFFWRSRRQRRHSYIPIFLRIKKSLELTRVHSSSPAGLGNVVIL